MKSLGNGKLTKSYAEDCVATREVLDRIGDKWSVMVIVNLAHGKMRFSDLKRAIEGISQRMLTHTLRSLERDGLVGRAVFPTVPPRVEYDLTRLGEKVVEPVTVLAKWAHRYRADIQKARDSFDRAAKAPPRALQA